MQKDKQIITFHFPKMSQVCCIGGIGSLLGNLFYVLSPLMFLYFVLSLSYLMERLDRLEISGYSNLLEINQSISTQV